MTNLLIKSEALNYLKGLAIGTEVTLVKGEEQVTGKIVEGAIEIEGKKAPVKFDSVRRSYKVVVAEETTQETLPLEDAEAKLPEYIEEKDGKFFVTVPQGDVLSADTLEKAEKLYALNAEESGQEEAPKATEAKLVALATKAEAVTAKHLAKAKQAEAKKLEAEAKKAQKKAEAEAKKAEKEAKKAETKTATESELQTVHQELTAIMFAEGLTKNNKATTKNVVRVSTGEANSVITPGYNKNELFVTLHIKGDKERVNDIFESIAQDKEMLEEEYFKGETLILKNKDTEKRATVTLKQEGFDFGWLVEMTKAMQATLSAYITNQKDVEAKLPESK